MSLTMAELVAFNTVLLAALLSPGAAMLFITRATVTGGRAAGIATGLGLTLTLGTPHVRRGYTCPKPIFDIS